MDHHAHWYVCRILKSLHCSYFFNPNDKIKKDCNISLFLSINSPAYLQHEAHCLSVPFWIPPLRTPSVFQLFFYHKSGLNTIPLSTLWFFFLIPNHLCYQNQRHLCEFLTTPITTQLYQQSLCIPTLSTHTIYYHNPCLQLMTTYTHCSTSQHTVHCILPPRCA